MSSTQYVNGHLITNNLSLDANKISNISFTSTGFVFNSNLLPSTDNLFLGTETTPWKGIHVSTGTVFLGPTGALTINNNGTISSNVGFAAPTFQVGATTPGVGIVLYTTENLLYYVDQYGSSGPVSIFKTASNSINNTYFTGGNMGIGLDNPIHTLDISGDINCNTLMAKNLTGASLTIDTITTNQVSFDNIGSIYFKTGSATGCFITQMNYNSSGANHYIYYNPNSKELTQASPMYFYSYSTGSQPITNASTPTSGAFQPITFNVNNILYSTFEHTANSSIFTGTFETLATLQFTYSIQFHTTRNSTESAAAVLYLDGIAIPGSYRSIALRDVNQEFALCNTFLVDVPAGEHTIELRAAATSTNVSVGGIPNILAPGSSYTSANLCCTRVI